MADGGVRSGAGELVRSASRTLADAGVAAPRVDAELLLAHVLAVPRGDVRRLAVLGSAVPDDAADAFRGLVARRAAREPLQHLTGVAPFRHLELAVGPGVFVPRPETEAVAQVAIDEAARVVAERGSAVVVDLCTGSGAIALAVATEVPGTVVHAVELDARAHGWAERNIAAAGMAVAGIDGSIVATAIPTAVPRVRLVRGDARTALRDLDGTVDVVVSNPPYVPPGAVPVDPEVAEHDPAVALYGLGADGLEVPRGVSAAAARLLRPGGLYVMEHAEVQAAAARAMVDAVPDPVADPVPDPVADPAPGAASGGAPGGAPGAASVGDTENAFARAVTRPDLTGRPRMVVARRRSAPSDPANVKD